MFLVVTAMMSLLAMASGPIMRVFDGGVAVVAAVFALGIIRTAVARVRGSQRIVLAAHEIIAPASSGREREVTIRYRDIHKLGITGDLGFNRVLHVKHAGGDLAIAGVMLGSTGGLDEIHALLKAGRKR